MSTLRLRSIAHPLAMLLVRESFILSLLLEMTVHRTEVTMERRSLGDSWKDGEAVGLVYGEAGEELSQSHGIG